MEALNIKDSVIVLIGNIGWKNYFAINCPAYIELVRDFYTTFVLNIFAENFTLASLEVVKVRLMGKSFKLSITEFNFALGLISEEYVEAKCLRLP